jgi:hypothetical protein
VIAPTTTLQLQIVNSYLRFVKKHWIRIWLARREVFVGRLPKGKVNTDVGADVVHPEEAVISAAEITDWVAD